MTEKEQIKSYFLLNRDAWEWEVENKTFGKAFWPKQFDGLNCLDCGCTFCEYSSNCEECSLGKSIGICGRESSPFSRWTRDEDIEGAKEILDFYNKFINEMEEKEWNLFRDLLTIKEINLDKEKPEDKTFFLGEAPGVIED